MSFYEDASLFWKKRASETPEGLISNILQEAQPSEKVRNQMAALLADSYAKANAFEKTKNNGQVCVEAALDEADYSEEELFEEDMSYLCDEIEEEKSAEEKLMAMSPREICTYLSKSIYGQKEAVKVASMLLYNHLRGRKRNILFLGPTGCGKTEIWRSLRALYSNIRIIDSTRITKEGWSGSFKLSNIFDGMSVEEAEHAIIVFDEFDKFCEPIYSSQGVDHSISSQNELLKFIEGTLVDCPTGKEKQTRKINTEHVSFVFCGSFVSLTEMKAERTKETSLGFGASIGTKDAYETYSEAITQEDLALYGNVRREICGRISRIVQLSGMTSEDYENILDDPKISPLCALEKEYSVHLRLEKETRKRLVEEAEQNRMGVRYLQSRIQQLLDDALFEDADRKRYVLCQGE